MKQALWIGLLIISAFGCARTPQGIVNGPKETGGSPKPTPSDKVTNVTDISKCVEGTSEKPSLFSSWSADFEQDKGKLRQTFTFKQGSIQNRLQCSVGNKSISVEASSSAAYTGEEIHVAFNDRVQRTYDDGKTKFSCSIGLTGGEVITYSFLGPCLKIESDIREALILVPDQH